MADHLALGAGHGICFCGFAGRGDSSAWLHQTAGSCDCCANSRGVSASVDTSQIDKLIEQEVAKRVDAALAQQRQRTEQMLQASEKRYEQRRQKDLVEFQQVMRYQNQQMSHWMVASNDLAGSRGAQ